MRYTDLFARITGLCVAVAGIALAGRELLVGAGGGGIGTVAPAALTTPETGIVAVGTALALAGFAVLAGRGRGVAVSVGGAAAVVAVASLAVGVGSSAVVLGVGAVALALLLAGASTGGQAVG